MTVAMTEVTIAIPFYSGLDYLRLALDSLRAQDCDEWLGIVVDDAGPDPEARQLVESYDDPRLSYVRNDANHRRARIDVGLRLACGGCFSSVWYMATRKAAVLPVPVWAWPATSRPRSAMGRVCAWIGVHCVNPASRMPACNAGWRCNESKRTELECGSLIKGPIG